MQRIKSTNWLDKYTRAMFLDAVFFNPNTNLFTAIRTVVEIPANGGIFVFDASNSYRLYNYVGGKGLVMMIIQCKCKNRIAYANM